MTEQMSIQYVCLNVFFLNTEIEINILIMYMLQVNLFLRSICFQPRSICFNLGQCVPT